MHNDIITDIAKTEIELSRIKVKKNITEQVESEKNRIIRAERIPEENNLPELSQHYKNHLLNKFIGRRTSL